MEFYFRIAAYASRLGDFPVEANEKSKEHKTFLGSCPITVGRMGRGEKSRKDEAG